ncbi:hypothetical protein HPB50_012688 [Hyalomma asiaticum]|uniref:Uncharacterized protein n=2 Tax=Hyalomma asiaticum TaxID=266040 RepID=A0ACB7TCJ7_HYAAI|nr:hypothetical protein HPB50_028807 [Hyalomma asiaticum]KAH6944788.1 hypothetical protein HPB50_005199 [Hyalomma asiaticum]KAH6946292.1 hypothetical protein HPB50_012688 [Hyalomma asiaticum]
MFSTQRFWQFRPADTAHCCPMVPTLSPRFGYAPRSSTRAILHGGICLHGHIERPYENKLALQPAPLRSGRGLQPPLPYCPTRLSRHRPTSAMGPMCSGQDPYGRPRTV